MRGARDRDAPGPAVQVFELRREYEQMLHATSSRRGSRHGELASASTAASRSRRRWARSTGSPSGTPPSATPRRHLADRGCLRCLRRQRPERRSLTMTQPHSDTVERGRDLVAGPHRGVPARRLQRQLAYVGENSRTSVVTVGRARLRPGRRADARRPAQAADRSARPTTSPASRRTRPAGRCSRLLSSRCDGCTSPPERRRRRPRSAGPSTTSTGGPTSMPGRPTARACGRADVYQSLFGYAWFVGGLGVTAAYGRIGCTVMPGGSGETERQISTSWSDYGTTAVSGTPSFMLHLAEAAEQAGPPADRQPR